MEAKTYQPAGYDSDRSDAQWELLKPLICAEGARGELSLLPPGVS
jgi:hypothetical protein